MFPSRRGQFQLSVVGLRRPFVPLSPAEVEVAPGRQGSNPPASALRKLARL